MARVTYLSDGADETVDGQLGDSVMITAVQNGIDGIVAECGGALSCATCHVYVDPGWFDKTGPAGEDEADMLAGAMCEPRETSRLSCQIELTPALDGLVVTLPEEQ
ncbi:2Fe-2S iron-sulfur cluster binding domain-containing protein [Rhodococcus fascians]|nr:2Fe-2S iron-sulfur cluster binding domain-containing protein [Rhodococcus fascians]MBY4237835.1 2Fe-2S iron-sulfur cluster binding domain-containing protein [Rhodococcus fascians]MBY4253414.1 2Fe-2S iron-sulfur cluster binding domain-containing protein [Rhodococcus fascians]MBY4269051.1 2Fe-2S iron-sulfur cluster binding domain-containing protein [Rhodococcus fascians]MBY4275104.1 2Fe-2S iron-sulfur cluster binding domain-containing protein [Rhodococcus fascians]